MENFMNYLDTHPFVTMAILILIFFLLWVIQSILTKKTPLTNIIFEESPLPPDNSRFKNSTKQVGPEDEIDAAILEEGIMNLRDNLKIISRTDRHKSYWFSEMGQTRPIGIVQVKDIDTGKYSYRIGTGVGERMDEDVHLIVTKGARFPKDAGDKIFEVNENS